VVLSAIVIKTVSTHAIQIVWARRSAQTALYHVMGGVHARGIATDFEFYQLMKFASSSSERSESVFWHTGMKG